VVETGNLRREDRLARLPELAAELGDIGILVATGREHPMRLEVARNRLRAGVSATGETLPASKRLLEAKYERFTEVEGADVKLERDTDAVAKALEELATVLSRAHT
jgi:hypothetical protein